MEKDLTVKDVTVGELIRLLEIQEQNSPIIPVPPDNNCDGGLYLLSSNVFIIWNK